MVACWNWIRDFVYKHCNSSYRQSQCANNKNTPNRTWIAKSQNESTEHCSRTTSTFRRYSNRFSIFSETHIFPNRFNYLWSVFLYHSCYLPLSLVVIWFGFGFWWHQKIGFYFHMSFHLTLVWQKKSITSQSS